MSEPDIISLTMAEVEGDPTNAKALKALAKAIECGWTENPVTSLVTRLKPPEGVEGEPIFLSWHLGATAKGKQSWRFAGARARNGQALTLNDAMLVMEDPSLIFPEPPETESDTDGCND